MKRSVALLSVVAVLIVGVAIGIVGTHLFYAQKFRRPDGPPGLMGRSFVDRLEGHLDLTADQRRQIDEILERSHEEAEMLRHEMQPRLRQLFESTGAEIEAILTPEQQEKFRQLRETQRGRMDRFLGPRGGRHPPGRPPRRGPPPDSD
jgi:Spy/CpxP family protein refolding chaperone